MTSSWIFSTMVVLELGLGPVFGQFLRARTGGEDGCPESDFLPCVTQLRLQRVPFDKNVLNVVFNITSEAKLQHVCRAYNDVVPCFRDRIVRCGNRKQRRMLEEVKKMLLFFCSPFSARRQAEFLKYNDCIGRELQQPLSTNCYIENHQLSQKIAACRQHCEERQEFVCMMEVWVSEQSLCTVVDIENACGPGASMFYTDLQANVFNENFPVVCRAPGFSILSLTTPTTRLPPLPWTTSSVRYSNRPSTSTTTSAGFWDPEDLEEMAEVLNSATSTTATASNQFAQLPSLYNLPPPLPPVLPMAAPMISSWNQNQFNQNSMIGIPPWPVQLPSYTPAQSYLSVNNDNHNNNNSSNSNENRTWHAFAPMLQTTLGWENQVTYPTTQFPIQGQPQMQQLLPVAENELFPVQQPNMVMSSTWPTNNHFIPVLPPLANNNHNNNFSPVVSFPNDLNQNNNLKIIVPNASAAMQDNTGAQFGGFNTNTDHNNFNGAQQSMDLQTRAQMVQPSIVQQSFPTASGFNSNDNQNWFQLSQNSIADSSSGFGGIPGVMVDNIGNLNQNQNQMIPLFWQQFTSPQPSSPMTTSSSFSPAWLHQQQRTFDNEMRHTFTTPSSAINRPDPFSTRDPFHPPLWALENRQLLPQQPSSSMMVPPSPLPVPLPPIQGPSDPRALWQEPLMLPQTPTPKPTTSSGRGSGTSSTKDPNKKNYSRFGYFYSRSVPLFNSMQCIFSISLGLVFSLLFT